MIPRAAGVLIPLFSLHSRNDLGRGEIPDLSSMVDLALAMGHRIVQLLPLNETAPSEFSPYSALSVFAIDPLYISARALDGMYRSSLERAREIVGQDRFVPRGKVRAAKLPLLEAAFLYFRKQAGSDEFRRFSEDNQGWLDDYSLFRALKDRFDFAAWPNWPAELRDRDPTAIAAARTELADSIHKYSYWQFIAARQWDAVRRHAGASGAMLGGDLSFLPALDSAEVWANPHLFDLSRSVGTPPDAFSAAGQRWGLPLPNWNQMRADGYAWWRMRVRHAATMFDLFRVDHVVGVFRTFSFPEGSDSPGSFSPADEDEQRAQGEAVLGAILNAAGASTVIAEDLGTIPPWVRKSLTKLGIAGYKVVRWEKGWHGDPNRFVPPATYPELSIATTGTHDTDTLAEWWRETAPSERQFFLDALEAGARVNPLDPVLGSALDAILTAIYESPSRLAVIPIQDLFGWEARINLPGTIGDANWSWRIPLPIEQIPRHPATRERIERLRSIAQRSGRF